MSCGSLLMPNTTFGFVLNRNASSPQNSANCSVVAAVGSLVLPITCMIQTCEKTKVRDRLSTYTAGVRLLRRVAVARSAK